MRPARALTLLLVTAVLPAAAGPHSGRTAANTLPTAAELHAAHGSDTLTTLRFPEGWPIPADQTP